MLGRDTEDGGEGTILEDVPPDEAGDRVVEYLQANDIL
jgi:hypothetical protein